MNRKLLFKIDITIINTKLYHLVLLIYLLLSSFILTTI